MRASTKRGDSLSMKSSRQTLPLPKIPGYSTEAVLGEGGMSIVYLAVQDSLARHVALKVMKRMLMTDPDFCRRFINEGRVIAKLSHPHIVTVYDIGASDDLHYLSMTYLPGGTLVQRLREGMVLSQAVIVLKCLADALAYAHARDIVHRDIKPANVLFTDNGCPVLTDFGIAKRVGSQTSLTSTGTVLGSAGYMSPEQAIGMEVDHRSDLYSLGIVFWEMLTGSLPYVSKDPFALAFMHVQEPIPQLPTNLRRFQDLFERLLAKRPENRFSSGEEIIRAVDAIGGDDLQLSTPASDETQLLPRNSGRVVNIGSGSGRIGPSPVSQSASRASRRGRVLVTAAAAAALAVVAGITGYFGYKNGIFAGPAAAGDDARRQGPSGLERTASLSTQTARHASEGESTGQATASTTTPQGEPGIDALLRKAEQQWEAGRLSRPPGDNAFETYNRVLALDPEHQAARQRLIEIGQVGVADKVFDSADALLRQGRIDEARRLIETGLKVTPGDERLLGLLRALDY